MSERSHSITVQFLVSGWGTDEDMDRRQELEDQVNAVLGDNGENTGAGGGSGSMDVSFSINDPEAARKAIVALMNRIGDPDDTVVTYSSYSYDDDGNEEDEGEEVVWWPPNYPYEFGIFGPTWKGPLPAEELAKLPADLQAMQGMWKVVRYDADDGSRSSEWSDELRFMFVRDIATVRHKLSIISHARFKLDQTKTPKQIDVHPIIGSNKGGVAFAVYELKGDVLQIVTASSGDPRPAKLLPESKHQPGRMVLHRLEE